MILSIFVSAILKGSVSPGHNATYSAPLGVAEVPGMQLCPGLPSMCSSRGGHLYWRESTNIACTDFVRE